MKISVTYKVLACSKNTKIKKAKALYIREKCQRRRRRYRHWFTRQRPRQIMRTCRKSYIIRSGGRGSGARKCHAYQGLYPRPLDTLSFQHRLDTFPHQQGTFPHQQCTSPCQQDKFPHRSKDIFEKNN
ncbi:uncharacterized protein LOC105183435 [Harpegnathos saltator]|uniref:uncharacterized protein LOC105183435 n=1 Tax=Harpegnathos saltator TaxID=610380 RepID=UPI00058B33FE|nr:uncharacterized protein LOC105183435 [Harpegnathos saltator]